MQTTHAIRLLKETCALQHTALKTEKSYTYWVLRYATFLKGPTAKPLSQPKEKMEAFLTALALDGVSASTQNQAFNALLFFYRYVVKQELCDINALRAKRPPGLRYCPDRSETLKLLAHVADVHNYPTRLIVHLLYACACEFASPSTCESKTWTSEADAFTSTSQKATRAGS